MMKDKLSPKIVYFGTPEFARPTLQALIQKGYNVILVVTQKDQPIGRKQTMSPTPIKVEAQHLGLKVCENLKELKFKIDELKPGLGIVAAYGKIIPQEILDLFPQGVLNIHPSLLPKYRGPSPIQTAILNGDDVTGISIIKLDEKMDHGSIISRIQISISKDDNYPSLSHKLAILSAELLITILPDYLTGKAKLQPQDDSKATYCEMISKEDGLINWSHSAEQIVRQIKAYAPWPGSFSTFVIKNKKINVKIIAVQVYVNVGAIHESPLPDDKQHLVGKFVVLNNQLVIQCGHGALVINKLQPEGKKEMPARAFINGYLRK